MLNIYICDKDISSQRKLSTAITKISQKKYLDTNIKTFKCGAELLSYQPEFADIICLDVMLSGALNGIETAKELRRKGCCAEIIFVTSNGEYVYEAYDINPLPVQYLIKEKITEEMFESVFLRAVSLAQKKSHIL